MAAYAAELKNGATATYTFSFERISDDYVKVQHLVNGTWTDVLKTDSSHPWSITGSTNTITMTGTQFPAGTGTVRIYRETPLTDLPVEFQSGSALAASQLNENYEQNFQAIQEISDHFLDKQTAKLDGNVDLNNNDLLNVKAIQFEGSTVDEVHTTLSVLDPDSNRTINLPNVSGTVPVMETVPTAHIQSTVAEIDQLHDVTDGTVAASKFVAVDADKDITGFRDLSITRNLDVDGNIDVDGTANVDGLDVDGNADISGNTVMHGNVELGDAATDEIDFKGQIKSDLVPLTDDTRSLGTSAKQWKDLHIDGTAEIDQLNADSVDINAGNIDGTTIGATTAAEATVTNLSVTGNTTLGNADTDDVTFTASLNSDILPKTNDSRSLGSTSKKFANVHSTAFTGALTGNADSATTSAHVTITAEGGVDEENRLAFVEDGQGAGSFGLESDADLTWNPSSSKLSATTFKGNLEGKADTADKLHAARTIAGVSFDGSVNISIPINNLSDVNVGTPGSAQDGQVIAWDNDNSEFALSATAGGGSGLSDVVSDGTPQLGGDLDVQDKKIFTDTGTNTDIVIQPKGTGAVNVSSSKIINVTDPTNNQDAATKKYVDDNTPATPDIDAVLQAGNQSNTDMTFKISGGNATIEFDASTGAAVFNQDSRDDGDFRVESDSNDHMLFVDASANRVGIGTSAPTQALDVSGQIIASSHITAEGDHVIVHAKGTESKPGHFRIHEGSEHVTITTADDVTGTYSIVLPAAEGTAGDVLKINNVTNTQCVMAWSGVDTAPRLEHSNTTDGFTIANDSNAAMVGPLTINSGQTITVGNANSVFKIL